MQRFRSIHIADRPAELRGHLSTKTPPDYPHSDKRKAFCTLPLSGPTAGRENCQHKNLPQTVHSPQTMHPEQPVTGPCCKGNCSQILASQRGTILSCMTEGRLNHILDILRSQQMLSRIDYETIISYPTVTSRARALLDICLCLGDKAAQVVVTVLTVNKCSPVARGSRCIGCPETNRLLL